MSQLSHVAVLCTYFERWSAVTSASCLMPFANLCLRGKMLDIRPRLAFALLLSLRLPDWLEGDSGPAE